MKGGPLLASILLAFSRDVLGATKAFNLSCTVLFFTVRAAQVGATVDVLLARTVTILAEIDVIGRGMTDSSTIDATNGARFVLLSEVPASTALCYINFVEGNVSDNEVSEEEDSVVQDGVGIVTLRVLELDKGGSDLLVLHVRSDPFGSLSVDEVLEKIVFGEFTAELFISD